MIFDGDTTSVFLGTYNLEEDETSEFLIFSMNETTETIVMGIGDFEPGDLYSTVSVTKLTGEIEESEFN